MTTRKRWGGLLVIAGALAAGAAGACGGEIAGADDVSVIRAELLGGALAGTDPAHFAAGSTEFARVLHIVDGLGPIFDERGCGSCHVSGALGGAGTNVDRRFGRFRSDGTFDPLASKGGSLRQLFALGNFTGSLGQACSVPVEHEPAQAGVPDCTATTGTSCAVRNVGRITTPLFGLGLVDAMPDSFFSGLAAAQPAAVRGVVNLVPIILPDPKDPAQTVGVMRAGRFGWKADAPNLAQATAAAYRDDVGITTSHCSDGALVSFYTSEPAPNGVAVPAGCDDGRPGLDRDVLVELGGIINCFGISTLETDVGLVSDFIKALAPPDRDLSNPTAVMAGDPLFTSTGCAQCHVRTTFTTPPSPSNGVPGNVAFNPFSDFLVHDMGALGDRIGKTGDHLAVTRRMRTAPLWGVRFRTRLLHDGSVTSVNAAINAHAGQGAASATAFKALSAAQQNNLVQFVLSL